MNKLRNTLISLGVLGIGYGIGYGVIDITKQFDIGLNTEYKKIINVNQKISKIEQTNLKTLLEDPNGPETFSQLYERYDNSLKEREQLSKDPNIINLEKRLDYSGSKKFKNILVPGFRGLLTFIVGFFGINKK